MAVITGRWQGLANAFATNRSGGLANIGGTIGGVDDDGGGGLINLGLMGEKKCFGLWNCCMGAIFAGSAFRSSLFGSANLSRSAACCVGKLHSLVIKRWSSLIAGERVSAALSNEDVVIGSVNRIDRS